MNNFWQRTISGVILVAIIILAFTVHPISALVLLSIIGVIGTDELARMGEENPKKKKAIRMIALFHSIVFLFFLWLPFHATWIVWAVQLLIAAVGVVLTFKENSFEELTKLAFGWLWIWLPVFLAKELIGVGNHQGWMLILVFIGLWSSDSGAYLVGKSLGKHKMIPHVSPNKTWEGTLGGMIIAGALVAYFGREMFQYHWIHGIALGILISFFGTFGDLIQSVVKRTFQVKDSGQVIPGHGGILDRFDSFLLAVPAVWLANLFF